jgi:two-component system chemotaxis response regulator CheB
LKAILGGLPVDFPAAVLIVTHIGSRVSILPSILERSSALPVRHAGQGELIAAGQVLLAPPDLHLTVAMDGERAYTRLSHGPKENHSRPAIDPLFRTAAAAYGPNAIGVLLSGFLDDGTVGLQAIKACGGIAVAQDPGEAEAPEMPLSAVRYVELDFTLGADNIAKTLVDLAVREAGMSNAPARPEEMELLDRISIENRAFNEDVDMADMDRIGSPAGLTCPECGGAIWEIRNTVPLRYRCHTGHAFTARSLEPLQGSAVEEALWAAVRALHEQERLFLRLHQTSQAGRNAGHQNGSAREYLLKAEQAKEHARLLRDLIATRMRIAPDQAA